MLRNIPAGPSHQQGYRADGCDILEMVGDIRIAKREGVEKAKVREERSGKKQRRRDRAPPDPAAGHPERKQDGCNGERVEILPPYSTVNGPTFVVKAQMGRPKELPRVEAQGPAGNERAFGKAQAPVR